jgi:hypothetical protein
MVIEVSIKRTLANTAEGVVLTIADFEIEKQYQQALIASLNRRIKKGELCRLSKGKYYKPKNTIFGNLPPSSDEIIKDLLQKGERITGYITGTRAFAQMGLTTQISSSILVGTNKYRRPVERKGNKISFLLQANNITEEKIPLLRILDAIRMIKEMPATSPDECIKRLCKLIQALPDCDKTELVNLAMSYRPYVRAITGAILEQIGSREITNELKMSLNGVTTYKIPISDTVLKTKKNWNIYKSTGT